MSVWFQREEAEYSVTQYHLVCHKYEFKASGNRSIWESNEWHD